MWFSENFETIDTVGRQVFLYVMQDTRIYSYELLGIPYDDNPFTEYIYEGDKYLNV